MEKYSTIVGEVGSGKHVELKEKDVPKTEFSKDIPESVLKELREPKYHKILRNNNIVLTKYRIAGAVDEDVWIIQAISSIEDLDRVCNTLSKRLREWHGYYFPEAGHRVEDNELFASTVMEKSKKDLMKEYKITQSMGPGMEEKDLEIITSLARQISDLYRQREGILKYLEGLMQHHCPNIQAVAGTMIGAKLLRKAGSLKHLSMMPSSTIQLLGAEKALFKHLRNKKIKPPKHGFILNHQYVLFAHNKEKGKRARMLAGKISIAAKVDYFRGEFIGDTLKEDLK